jgi:hypothetical protein
MINQADEMLYKRRTRAAIDVRYNINLRMTCKFHPENVYWA